MSEQERVSWVQLIVTLVFGLLGTGPLQPMHTAQLLLLALTFACTTVYASRIVYYRRGY